MKKIISVPEFVKDEKGNVSVIIVEKTIEEIFKRYDYCGNFAVYKFIRNDTVRGKKMLQFMTVQHIIKDK